MEALTKLPNLESDSTSMQDHIDVLNDESLELQVLGQLDVGRPEWLAVFQKIGEAANVYKDGCRVLHSICLPNCLLRVLDFSVAPVMLEC